MLVLSVDRPRRIDRVTSGGYTRGGGNRRLRRNHCIVASFLLALVEGCRFSSPMASTTPC
jgi:hypothetical protein